MISIGDPVSSSNVIRYLHARETMLLHYRHQIYISHKRSDPQRRRRRNSSHRTHIKPRPSTSIKRRSRDSTTRPIHRIPTAAHLSSKSRLLRNNRVQMAPIKQRRLSSISPQQRAQIAASTRPRQPVARPVRWRGDVGGLN